MLPQRFERLKTHVATQKMTPDSINDYVAFWDFQEDSAQPRISRGPQVLELEVRGMVERVEGGICGPHHQPFFQRFGRAGNLPARFIVG